VALDTVVTVIFLITPEIKAAIFRMSFTLWCIRWWQNWL